MTVRAYQRLDPRAYERKVLTQGYPLAAFAAFIGALGAAESQPDRGVFRSAAILRALLGPGGRWVCYLVEHGDLIQLPDGRLAVDGWEEWQEGDWKVRERVDRIRNRKRTAQTVTGVTVGTVSTPSDGGRQSVSVSVGISEDVEKNEGYTATPGAVGRANGRVDPAEGLLS